MSEFGPFRPLKPLVEGDGAVFLPQGAPRLQRLRDRAALVEAVTSQPATVLVGPSGSGKTSLVQAGLVPALRARGWDVFGPDAPAPASQGVLVVDDALASDADVEGLLLSLTAAAAAGAAILLVVEDGDLWRLSALESKTGRLPGRVVLRPLPEGEVAQLVEEAVLAGGAYFEAGLAGILAEELTRSGPVSPAVIQLAAGSMVAERVTTVKAFGAAGGVEGLRARFLQKAARAAAKPNGRAAIRMLAELAAAPTATVANLAEAAELGPAATTQVLQALEVEGLLRRHSDGSVALAAEWLRPIIVHFTAVERQAAERARSALRRARSRSIPLLTPAELGRARRHAGRLDEADSSIVRRSSWLWRSVVAAAVVLPLVAVGTSWLGQSHRAHLSAGAGPGSPVLVRLGSATGWARRFPHQPPFGSVLVDSGWVRGSLRGDVPTATLPRSAWETTVEAELQPVPKAAMAWLVSDDSKPLAALFADPASLPSALALLEIAGHGEPAEAGLLRQALAAPGDDSRRQALQVAAAWLRRGIPASGTILTEALHAKTPTTRALAMQILVAAATGEDAGLRGRALALLASAALLDDGSVRKHAIDLLAAEADRGTPGARAALVAALGGPGRSDAVAALGSGAVADSDESAAALAALASDPKANEDARIDALSLLSRRSGDLPALPALQTVAGSPRWRAAVLPSVLRGQPSDDTWPRIVEAAHGTPPLRAAAATLLSTSAKTPDSVKLIKSLAQDSNGEVRAAAVRALPVLGGEGQSLLVKAMKSGNADAERAVIDVAAKDAAKRSTLLPLLELGARSPHPATRRAATTALLRLATEKPAAVASVLGRLARDKSAELRVVAVEIAGAGLSNDRGVREESQLLRSLSRDPDASVRRQAALALASARGAGRAVAAKVALIFAADADAAVRAEAITTLAALGASDGNWSLWLRDRDRSVRAAARRGALAVVGLKSTPELDAAIADGLAAATSPAPLAERVEWASLAGALGAPTALGMALSSPFVEVRRAALGAARALAGGIEAAVTDEDVEVRRAALALMARSGADAALAAAMTSPDARTRVAVLRALTASASNSPTTAAKTALITRGLTDGSEMVRVAAAGALGAAGGSQTPPAPATTQPGTPAVSAAALDAALGDPARDVREAAAVSAARLWQGAAPHSDDIGPSFEKRAAAVWAGAKPSADDSPLLRAVSRAATAGTRPEDLGRLLGLLR